MNISIPELNQFVLEELGQTAAVDKPNAEISFKVDIKPARVTRRVVVGILDESRKRGIAVAIYPATGEVCDLCNGGGVIGYLANTPLAPAASTSSRPRPARVMPVSSCSAAGAPAAARAQPCSSGNVFSTGTIRRASSVAAAPSGSPPSE